MWERLTFEPVGRDPGSHAAVTGMNNRDQKTACLFHRLEKDRVGVSQNGAHHNSLRHALGLKPQEAQQQFFVSSTLTEPWFPLRKSLTPSSPDGGGTDVLVANTKDQDPGREAAQ